MLFHQRLQKVSVHGNPMERLRLQDSDPRNPDSEFQCCFMSVAILRSCPAWALSCSFKEHFSQYCHLMMWPSEPAGSYLLALQAKSWFVWEFANYHSPLTDYPHLLCIYLDALLINSNPRSTTTYLSGCT